jgi:RNA polymerase sigma-70 factor (ECF subfamily)
MKDQVLITLFKNSDPSALTELFNRYHASLCMLAYRVVGDKDQAKDIVQEVFIKLWRNRNNLHITISLEAYLKRAAINSSINYLNTKAVSKKQNLDKSDLDFMIANSVDDKTAFDELSLRADHAINSLPTRTKAVFTLIRWEGMSYKEVAEALNISTKAVEKEMLKALKLLREALKDYLNTVLILGLINFY